ncbi:MAG: phosphoglucosamine mutase [Planctomycetota bacterium]|jgi:phosphomannomutase
MASELIITISGLRGIVGENLTAGVAIEYGSAFGTFLRSNYKDSGRRLRVCIGRDSRPSGQMLTSAVADGLCSVGIDVVDLGIVTTPGVGIMIRHLGCVGGLVITASHNPGEYNGIKLLLDNGVAPPGPLAGQIKKIFLEKEFEKVGSVEQGRMSQNDDTDSVHIEKVLAIVDKDSIAGAKFKVVLDSVNGAGGRAGVKLLEELGCEVVGINIEATGEFAHEPEPTRENLTGLCEEVARADAAIGFAQDPDADRLAIVDEGGRYIGEEYTLALAAKYVFARCKGPAAANLSTSRMFDDIAGEMGCEVIRTAVGEANVAEAMMKNDCVIGGEGNGGVIDLRVGPVRDSLVAMAFVLGLMAEDDKSIGAIADRIGGYCMDKVKIKAGPEQTRLVIDRAKEAFAGARIDLTDGARFDLADGWVHIRPSNTEPVMRVIVETKTAEATRKYIDTVGGIVKEATS